MPLDPQVKQYLDRMQATGRPAAGTISAEEMRKSRRAEGIMLVDDREISGPGGPIPLRVYTPPGSTPLPILVYFHGGGFVTGDLDITDMTCRILSRWAGCIVVSVNYRHAPEHRFPAAVEDSYAATVWAAENASTLGGDPNRIGVGGASAGGNLAAAVTLMARDNGNPRLVYQYLVYPVTDLTIDTPSKRENGTGYGLTTAQMTWYNDQYVPNEADRANPLASPLQATDLSGLPPTLVITAEYDPLRDEGEMYAQRLQEAGVPTQLKRYDGMIHGFMGRALEFDQAKIAFMESANALKSAFALGE